MISPVPVPISSPHQTSSQGPALFKTSSRLCLTERLTMKNCSHAELLLLVLSELPLLLELLVDIELLLLLELVEIELLLELLLLSSSAARTSVNAMPNRTRVFSTPASVCT